MRSLLLVIVALASVKAAPPISTPENKDIGVNPLSPPKTLPAKVPASPHTFSEELHDDESRLEPIPREASGTPRGVDTVPERETSHKPTEHDLLMREKAQQEAKRLQSLAEHQEQDVGSGALAEDTSSTSGDTYNGEVASMTPQVNQQQQDALVDIKEVTTPSDATESSSVVPPRYVASEMMGDTNSMNAKSSMDTNQKENGMEKESLTTKSPVHPEIPVVQESDPVTVKENVPVLYSLEGDMMPGQDTQEKDFVSAKDASSTKEKLPTDAVDVPIRYTASVSVDEANDEDLSTGTSDKVVPESATEEAQLAKAAPVMTLKTETLKVQGDTREFGAVPKVEPFSEDLRLQANDVRTYEK